MTRIVHIACLLFLLLACNRQPYVEHKVSLEKKSGDCIGIQPSFRLNSNFGGERYEFQKCLPAGYDKSLVRSERRGDTVVVHFPVPAGQKPNALFQVTVDIDSYPKYSFLTIDEDTYTIIPTDK